MSITNTSPNDLSRHVITSKDSHLSGFKTEVGQNQSFSFPGHVDAVPGPSRSSPPSPTGEGLDRKPSEWATEDPEVLEEIAQEELRRKRKWEVLKYEGVIEDEMERRANAISLSLALDQATTLYPSPPKRFTSRADIVDRLLPYHIWQIHDSELAGYDDPARPGKRIKVEDAERVEAGGLLQRIQGIQHKFTEIRWREGMHPSNLPTLIPILRNQLSEERDTNTTISNELSKLQSELRRVNAEKSKLEMEKYQKTREEQRLIVEKQRKQTAEEALRERAVLAAKAKVEANRVGVSSGNGIAGSVIPVGSGGGGSSNLATSSPNTPGSNRVNASNPNSTTASTPMKPSPIPIGNAAKTANTSTKSNISTPQSSQTSTPKVASPTATAPIAPNTPSTVSATPAKPTTSASPGSTATPHQTIPSTSSTTSTPSSERGKPRGRPRGRGRGGLRETVLTHAASSAATNSATPTKITTSTPSQTATSTPPPSTPLTPSQPSSNASHAPQTPQTQATPSIKPSLPTQNGTPTTNGATTPSNPETSTAMSASPNTTPVQRKPPINITVPGISYATLLKCGILPPRGTQIQAPGKDEQLMPDGKLKFVLDLTKCTPPQLAVLAKLLKLTMRPAGSAEGGAATTVAANLGLGSSTPGSSNGGSGSAGTGTQPPASTSGSIPK